MGRSKIEIKYISDDRKRSSTFEKRRIGLFKKASELSKLCKMNVAVLVFNDKSLYSFANDGLIKFQEQYNNLKKLYKDEDFSNETLANFLNKKSSPSKSTDNSPDLCFKSPLTDEQDNDPNFLNFLKERGLIDSYNNTRGDELAEMKGDMYLPSLSALSDDRSVSNYTNTTTPTPQAATIMKSTPNQITTNQSDHSKHFPSLPFDFSPISTTANSRIHNNYITPTNHCSSHYSREFPYIGQSNFIENDCRPLETFNLPSMQATNQMIEDLYSDTDVNNSTELSLFSAIGRAGSASAAPAPTMTPEIDTPTFESIMNEASIYMPNFTDCKRQKMS